MSENLLENLNFKIAFSRLDVHAFFFSIFEMFSRAGKNL